MVEGGGICRLAVAPENPVAEVMTGQDWIVLDKEGQFRASGIVLGWMPKYLGGQDRRRTGCAGHSSWSRHVEHQSQCSRYTGLIIAICTYIYMCNIRCLEN